MTGESPARPAAAATLPWLAALLAGLVLAGVLRPLLPIDETRYAAVAWEMWQRGDFLVPHLNGDPYHHKPPLLFWILHAGWWLFGVNEAWVRLVPPLLAAGTLGLTALLARELFPERPAAARMAPFILLAAPLFAYFATALMFDMLLALFVVLGQLGLARAWRRGGVGGFAMLAVGLGGALFAKGPVALLHLLPLAVLAPLWARDPRPAWGRWAAGVLLALLAGAAMILAWAIPAAVAGGEEYGRAIFWGQTAGRMAKSFAHQAPWWAYLPALPFLLAPWLLWWRGWRGIDRRALREPGLRFAFIGMAVCLLAFSAISGKRWHYLLPVFPLVAIAMARGLADDAATGAEPRRWSSLLPGLQLAVLGLVVAVAGPLLQRRPNGLENGDVLVAGGLVALAAAAWLAWQRPRRAEAEVLRIATAATVSLVAVLLAVDVSLRRSHDVDDVAARLGAHQAAGRPVAVNDQYHGQWTFAGRLAQPLAEIERAAAADWLAAHPDGRVVFIYRKPEDLPAGPRVEHDARYRGARLAILAAP